MVSQFLVSNNMIHALGWSLVHFLWQGAVLALIPTLALMFRSPRIRYSAACVAMQHAANVPVAARSSTFLSIRFSANGQASGIS